MPSFRKQQGFTLTEAVIVMAILAILAAWAVPSFLEMRDRMALRSAGEDFLSSLAEARMDAAKRGTPVTLNLNSTVNRLPSRVSLVEDTTVGSVSDTPGQVVIEPRLGLLQTAGDAGKFELASGDYRIRFELTPVAQGRLCDPGTGKNPGVPSC